MMNHKYLCIVVCALFQLALCATGNAQLRSMPASFTQWIKTPGLKHATVTLEVVRLPKTAPKQSPDALTPAIDRTEVIYSYDAERLMTPASVMKLVTAATGFRMLGGDYVWPDSIALIDTAEVALPGLERYNPDWLIEDIDTEYMQPMDNLLPDSGMVLREVMHNTLTESLNLEAETLLHLLTPSCRLDSGLLAVNDYWAARGIDMEGIKMYDGCGLSPSDRVTAHFMNSLLADMQFDDDFRKAIPIVGREGTVRRLLKGSRLAGNGRLKSGTIKSAVTYAGYIKGSDSRTYAVSIFVNNHTCAHSDVRRGIEKVLLSLIP